MTYIHKYSTVLFSDLDAYINEQLEFFLLGVESHQFSGVDHELYRLKEDIHILIVEFFRTTPYDPLNDEDEKFLRLVNSSEYRAYEKFKIRLERLFENEL